MIRFLEWDSAFWGLRVGRVESNRISPESLPSLQTALGGYECVYFLADSLDGDTAFYANALGFQFVDQRMTYRLEPAVVNSRRCVTECGIRLATEGDRAALVRIAGSSHRASRFYFDRRFPSERADDLYRIWIEKSLTNRTGAVHTLVTTADNRAIGYLTCELSTEGGGQIGLVGLDERFRGRGWGRLLLSAAVSWFAEHSAKHIDVVTQGRNVGAQRLYQGAGFHLTATEVWYHWWMERS